MNIFLAVYLAGVVVYTGYMLDAWITTPEVARQELLQEHESFGKVFFYLVVGGIFWPWVIVWAVIQTVREGPPK